MACRFVDNRCVRSTSIFGLAMASPLSNMDKGMEKKKRNVK